MKRSNLKNFISAILLGSLIMPSAAQQTSFDYIHPVDGSKGLNPEQTIILRQQQGIDPESIMYASISLCGSASGETAFSYVQSKDLQTLVLKPSQPFSPGEKVGVVYEGGLRSLQGVPISPVNIDFHIIRHDRDELWQRHSADAAETGKQPRALLQDHEMRAKENHLPPDFPPPDVTLWGEPDYKYIFLNMISRFGNTPWQPYIAIIDCYGIPIYFNKSNFNRHNFSMLPDGNLCYSISTLPNSHREKYFIMDSTYTVIDSVNTGNGYILDSHDMLLLKNGNYLVMSYDPQPVNMSLIVPGGDPEAIVTGLVIQEVDNNENVFFQWRSWDHFEITDATDDINLLAGQIDYVHGNALEIDYDGNILLSSRHLDEITKIDFTTGDVIWRMGMNSENNMFQINNDPHGFSHQHDIRRLANGNYTIFDNGNLNYPQHSRALEYAINENNLTADLIWEYHHTPEIFSASAGGFMVLPDGERIVGWGSNYPVAATVIDEDDDLLLELRLPDFVSSYRAFRSPWETSVFKTREVLSLGNYSGYSGWKQNKLFIFNTSSEIVRIKSVHHHTDNFQVMTPLPVSIFPGSHKSIEIGFSPDIAGDVADRLTLNYDNADTTERISWQMEVKAYYDEEVPSVHFYPNFDAHNVDPSTEIYIHFNEPVYDLFGGEIHDEIVSSYVEFRKEFFEGDPVPFEGMMSADNMKMSIIPDMVLEQDQQYYIKLKGGLIKNSEGNLIRYEEESYFETGTLTGLEESGESLPGIYPNPFREYLSIQVPTGEYSCVRIFNSKGKLIMEQKDIHNRTILDVGHYARGIYYLHFTDPRGTKEKVIKTIKF